MHFRFDTDHDFCVVSSLTQILTYLASSVCFQVPQEMQKRLNIQLDFTQIISSHKKLKFDLTSSLES